jgi:hypothetical protein
MCILLLLLITVFFFFCTGNSGYFTCQAGILALEPCCKPNSSIFVTSH